MVNDGKQESYIEFLEIENSLLKIALEGEEESHRTTILANAEVVEELFKLSHQTHALYAKINKMNAELEYLRSTNYS